MNPDTNRFEQLSPKTVDGIADMKRRLMEASAPPTLPRARPDGSLAHVSYADLIAREQLASTIPLYRPDGSPVPDTWTKFTIGEQVIIKGYTFEVTDIGEDRIIFKPVGPVIVGGTL